MMSKINNLSAPSRKIIQWIMISAGAIIVVGAIVYRSWVALPFAFSVTIVSALNVLKIWMLERTVNKISDMDDPGTGKTYVKFQYLVRYFGTVILLLAIGFIYLYSPIQIVNVWGAIAGIFTMQIAVMRVRFIKFEEDTPQENDTSQEEDNLQEENAPKEESTPQEENAPQEESTPQEEN